MSAQAAFAKPPTAPKQYLAPGAVVSAATPSCAPGPAHTHTPQEYDAVLLAGFGGPRGQADVLPFLRNVTSGRGIPDERLEEVAHHYRHFGGVSPISAQTEALQAALAAALEATADRALALPVYLGNRNWEPYLSQALTAANAAGHTRLLMIPTSAYASYSSCRQYREDIADALAATGLEGQVMVDKVRQFSSHPGFIEAFWPGLLAAWEEVCAELPAAEGAQSPALPELFFVTHSVPTVDAELSGPAATNAANGWGEGAYVGQHLLVATELANRIQGAVGRPVTWHLTYQSRSGPPTQPWLEPDINDALTAAAGRGLAGALIVPIGFLSDHMEVLWDLDEEALQTCAELGIPARRTPTPGVEVPFVQALVDLVRERVHGVPVQERASVGEPWFDVCRAGCCENVRRGFQPAVAGLLP